MTMRRMLILMIAVIGMFGSDAFAIYAPSTGRFMQRDPIGYKDGMNLYAYVGSSPLNALDPYGLFKIVFDDSISPDDQRRLKKAIDSACDAAKRMKDELDELRNSLSECESDCLKDELDELDKQLSEFSNKCDDNTTKLTIKQRKLSRGVEAETDEKLRFKLSKRIRGRRSIVPVTVFVTTFSLEEDSDWRDLSESQLKRLAFHEMLHVIQYPLPDQDGTGKITDPHNLDNAANRPLNSTIPMVNMLKTAKRKCSE